MELLNADIVLVDGRSYRALYKPGSGAQGGKKAAYEEDVDEEEFWDEDGARGGGGAGWDGGAGDNAEEEASVDISQEGDSFVARLHLDSELFPFLIGQGGRTRKRIEDDTGVRIAFPSRGTQSGPGVSSAIVVKGPSRAAVARACTQLEVLVSQQLAARGARSLDYNYFLCLPLATPETAARFEAFRDAVLAEPGAAAAGLEPSVFMDPQHLHLTIAMLKLYSDERRELARRTLHSLAPRVKELLGGAPLEIRLKGLEYMTDDPAEMHVMYLDVKEAPGRPGGLQRVKKLCAEVVEAFSKAGLLLPQDERAVKLHATVVNTRYRRPTTAGSGSSGGSRQGEQQRRQQQGGGGPGREREQRRPFDGRGLLERHGGLDLGTVRLPAVHISQRGKYDAVSGFYECFDSLALAPA